MVRASLAGAKMMMLKKVEIQPAGLIPSTSSDIYQAIEKVALKADIQRIKKIRNFDFLNLRSP